MKRNLFACAYIVFALVACQRSDYSSNKINDFLQADFNRDGKPERIYLEGEGGNNKQLVIEQEKSVYLKIPYYDSFKEPYFNTSLAVVYKEDGKSLPRPRLLVKGGREREVMVFEFQGDKMQPITLNEREKRIFQ